MPRLKFSQRSLRDLGRLHDFLAEKNPEAGRRAAQTLLSSLRLLKNTPKAGRTVEGLPPAIREWQVRFGRGSYLVRYHYTDDKIVVLAIRHSRESSF